MSNLEDMTIEELLEAFRLGCKLTIEQEDAGNGKNIEGKLYNPVRYKVYLKRLEDIQREIYWRDSALWENLMNREA